MTNIVVWNVRGFNNPVHIAEARKLVEKEQIGIIGLLEVRVRTEKIEEKMNAFKRDWKFITELGKNGVVRIQIGWNPTRFDVSLVEKEEQWTHVHILELDKKERFYLTFIYGAPIRTDRPPLWNAIKRIAVTMKNEVWGILGDFNAVRNPMERRGGRTNWTSSDEVTQETFIEAEIDDLRGVGAIFTWQKDCMGFIMRKLDRAMGNAKWFDRWPESYANYLPPMTSDHSPIVVNRNEPIARKIPFKFYNYWRELKDYKETVEEAWRKEVKGTAMYCIYMKLKATKVALRELKGRSVGDLRSRVADAREEVKIQQNEILCGRVDENKEEEYRETYQKYREMSAMEESMLKQKARVQWLKLGDTNNSFFHRQLKMRTNANAISVIRNEQGEEITDSYKIKELLVNHFKKQFTSKARKERIVQQEIECSEGQRLYSNEGTELWMIPNTAEIKDCLFNMPLNKSPGPDGFTSEFYRGEWKLISNKFCAAVQEAFRKKNVIKQANNTIITLIPKTQNPTEVNDFRPIACCNVLYKCISKIIAERLKIYLTKLVGLEQSAFVPGRKIIDNILLAQELMKGYGKKER